MVSCGVARVPLRARSVAFLARRLLGRPTLFPSFFRPNPSPAWRVNSPLMCLHPCHRSLCPSRAAWWPSVHEPPRRGAPVGAGALSGLVPAINSHVDSRAPLPFQSRPSPARTPPFPPATLSLPPCRRRSLAPPFISTSQ